MEFVFNLMLTSFLVFVIMLIVDGFFHVSDSRNPWLSEVYPIIGATSLILAVTFGFIFLLTLIWT